MFPDTELVGPPPHAGKEPWWYRNTGWLSYPELRASGHRPRLHPNGFVQLNLTGDGIARLHVWPKVPLPAQKTRHPIHDHCFALMSTIIAGRMTNVEYVFDHFSQAQREAFKGELYKLHVAERIGNDDTILRPTNAPAGALRQLRCITCGPGQTYQMPVALLHDSIPVPGKHTCTLMVKTRVDPTYRPLVAVPLSVEPDNDFRRETIGEEVLWQEIYQALQQCGRA